MSARQHRPGADPTREIAYDILAAVLHRRGSLEDALEGADAAVPARDRAAAHRLAATVLRRLGTLDAVLRPWLRRPPPPEVRLLLLLGAAQVLFLQTPAHAAVGTIVDLARRRQLGAFSGLVNAVLRRVAGSGAAVLDGLDEARLDVPAWLWTSWGGQARPIAEALRHEAPLDLTLRPGTPIPEGGVRLANGSVRLPAGTRVAELAGYEAGAFWVQDAAATLPVRLLAPRPGERIADSLRRSRRQDRAARRQRRARHSPRPRSCAPGAAAAEPRTAAPAGHGDRGRRQHLAARGAVRRGCCSMRRAAPPARSGVTPTCGTPAVPRTCRRCSPPRTG